MTTQAKSPPRKFTVPVVWRKIVKKNERQGADRYDVLICNHVVLADADNTYRRARACPECRIRAQAYADQLRPAVDAQPHRPAQAAALPPKPAPRKRSTRASASSAWCVYVLRCRDGSLYTGATNDLAHRLERHAAGEGARYTRSRLPIVLVYEERTASKSAALRRELAVKRFSRAEKLALVGTGPARRPTPGSRKRKQPSPSSARAPMSRRQPRPTRRA